MIQLRFTRILAALLLLPAAATAQVATGKVVDANGAPLRGAFVQLLRTGGQSTAVLTGTNGEFVIRMRPGRYSLRADLIGHRTGQVDAFDIAERETRTFTIRLEPSAVKLQALSVTSSRRCQVRPDAAGATAVVWQEAVKALEVSRWVESGGAGVFRTRSYEQSLGHDLKPASYPVMRFVTLPGTRAFFALDPDTLSRYGFVRTAKNDRVLYGPDAEVLLSDVFLNDHCFRLERSPEHPGLIGLGFEPVPGRRVVEIRGVLWLDEETAALRFIDFGYVNEQFYTDRNYAGGRTEFEHLPSGAWIVRRWHVRGPRLTRTIRGELQIAGAHETGGEVLDVAIPGQRTTELVPRFAVAGTVFDSIRGAPLANAQVYLAGTQFNVHTDANGAFSIADVPQGDYYIAFGHPRMDSLPQYPPPAPLRVDSSTSILRLAVASALTLTEKWCTPEERLRVREITFDTATTNRGLVFGRVRTTEGPLEGAIVSVSWTRLHFPTSNILDALQKPVSIEMDTDGAGRFSLCGAPINHPFTIQISYGRQRMIDPDLRLGYVAMLYRDYLFRRAQ